MNRKEFVLNAISRKQDLVVEISDRIAFQNMVPALIGALLFPYILKAPKQAIVPIILPVILIFILGRSFFSSNQSYIMVGVIVLSALYSYSLFKKKIIG